MNNSPKVKIGIVAVSRDCFPESLSDNRRKALVDAYTAKYDAADIYECPVCIVESEIHMVQALEDVKAAGCNALVVYLGNFGPEISETLLAKHFGIPFYMAAPLSTIDPRTPDGAHIPIEERPDREVTHVGETRIVPEGVPVFNFAFDVTPADCITGIITEKGVLRAPYGPAIAAALKA